MQKVYLILLILAAVLLLVDTFSGNTSTNTGKKIQVKLLPLGLYFWVLVPLIQIWRGL